MRYQIEGESQATGLPVTVIVDADSTLGARRQAADMGIDIVTLNVASDDADHGSAPPLPVRPALSRQPRGLLIALIVAVSVLGLGVLLVLFGALFWVSYDSGPTTAPMKTVIIDSQTELAPVQTAPVPIQTPDPPVLVPAAPDAPESP